MKNALMTVAVMASLLGCEVRHVPATTTIVIEEPEHQLIYVHEEYCYEEWEDSSECMLTYCYDNDWQSWYVYDVECYY